MKKTVMDELGAMVGIDLSGFQILQMTEVYKVDDDGRRSKSLGYFRDPTLARAFAGQQEDKAWHETRRVLVLTNEVSGFLLDTEEEVKFFNEEEEAVRLKEAAIAKLDPAERSLLGFS